MKPIRIGTRKSNLAVWQARYIQGLINAQFPNLPIELTFFTTQGDRTPDKPLPEIGGKGLFTQELEAALYSSEIDLAVHSLKDLPTETPDGLTIGAVPERASAFDALVSRERLSLDELSRGAVIGTGSHRRAAQLLAHRPDLHIKPMRGNVETRIRKVMDGDYDAAVLAVAGLQRLGLHDLIDEIFQPPMMLPAPGQGALGVQARAGDLLDVLRAIDHFETRAAVTAERAFLRTLEAGCGLPVGAYATVTGRRILMQGRVSDLLGQESITVQGEAPVEESAKLGRRLADSALTDGAALLIMNVDQEFES
jgi:hydroxymethylbilane synthase